MKFSEFFKIVKPNYVYLRLKPNYSIRNNSTHKIAKSISSLYSNLYQNIKREEEKLLKAFGKEFLVATKYRYEVNSKVSYFIYIEKKKVEFYFIVPEQFLSIIKEKAGDCWANVTIEQVKEIPRFKDPMKYQMVYQKEDALSLRSDRRDSDLLRSNLNIIDVLDEGDKVGIFYNFMPTSQFSWRSSYQATLNKLKNRMPVDRDKIGMSYMLKATVGFVHSLVDSVFLSFGEKKSTNEINIFERALERLNGSERVSECTIKKATSTILNTQILVLSESQNALRQRNNARSLAQSFDAIAGDNQLIPKPFRKNLNMTAFTLGSEVNKMGDEECQNLLSLAGREILERYDCIEKVDTKETEVPEDLQKGRLCIGMNKFRGNEQNAYLSTDKEYQMLTLVLIGPTRAGKSTLIGNLANDAINANECVVLFDFIANCEVSQEVSALFPKEKTLNIECGDFKTLQGLGYNEVRPSLDPNIHYVNAKNQATQLETLINSVNSDETRLTSKMERFLESASLAVFINGGSIKDVFDVLQDHRKRQEFIQRIPKNQLENMEEYISSLHELDDYTEIKVKEGKTTTTRPELTGTKYTKIEGIIDRLNKLKKNPYMEKMLKKSTQHNIDLVEELQKNQLICIKMPETMFGTDGERDIYTTYWLTKLWLSLQIRKQLYPGNMKKVNLFVDELYQVQNTEKQLTKILSRLAKFGLKPIISCHYLNQIKHIREELRSANASYMLISGCDKHNFKELSSELAPFEEEDLLRLPRYHSLNLIKSKDGYSRFITKLPKPISK